MSFIDDHVFPREFLENTLFSNQHFIGSDYTIPTPGHHCIPDEFISGFLVTNQTNCPQGWTPFFEFVHPIGQGWFRYQNHVGSIDVFEMLHKTQQTDGLKGFSQTHLIGQDTIDVVFVQRNHPIETTDLVISHFTILKLRKYIGTVIYGKPSKIFEIRIVGTSFLPDQIAWKSV